MEEPFESITQPEDGESLLSEGWKGILVENNRLYYVNETEKSCCWIPPPECWQTRRGLPYGWEMARMSDGRRYYINHLKKETYRSLPSTLETLESSLPPRTRTVVVVRDAEIGFGFVAGSEKPVLIRSVAEDGPSAGKLHANDQILKINGEDVYEMPQSDVIARIKQYNEELSLEVISNDDVQDVKNKGQKKSSIMSRATRERRRSNPVNVRFAETPVLVQFIGSPPSIPLRRSSLPLIPNALKIFLENGQTRSFLYNPDTIIKEVFVSLCEKIGVKKIDRFSLVLQATQTLNESYVLPNELASQIYARRNCSSTTWLCKLHLVIAPKDINIFVKEDPVAFEYFYKQMCSCVVEGRFGWEIKYDIAIKLAALHLQQYAMEDKVGKTGKVSVKAIEKEVGSLDTFVPIALVNTMQKKDLQRVLAQQIKQTRNLCPPGQKYISPLQAKLQYLKICSEMKMYGGKQFNAVILDQSEDTKPFFADQNLASVIFVGPNVGLSHVVNHRSFTLNKMADFNQINGLVVTPHTDGKQNLKIFLTNGKSLTLLMGPIFETQDLVYLINGYCKQLADNAKTLSIIDMTSTGNLHEVTNEMPPYANRHRVLPDAWSYSEEEDNEELKDLDLRQRPQFEGTEMYKEINGNKIVTPHLQCNGIVETNINIPGNVDGSPNLHRIAEEPSTPRDKVTHLPNGRPHFPDHVDGRGTTRKSLVHLDDDLSTESNDDDVNEDKSEVSQKYKVISNQILTKHDVPHVIIQGEAPKSLVDSKDLSQSEERPESDVLDGKETDSKDTSVVQNSTTKLEVTVNENRENDSNDNVAKDNTSFPRPDAKESEKANSFNISNEESSTAHDDLKLGTNIVNTEGKESRVVLIDENPSGDNHQIILEDKHPDIVDGSSENTDTKNNLDISITSSVDSVVPNSTNDSTLLDSSSSTKETDDKRSENTSSQTPVMTREEVANIGENQAGKPSVMLNHNGDIKSSHLEHKRRRSSGYIPVENVQKVRHSLSGEHYITHDHVTSRQEACDSTLEKLYMHKAKLNSILHWNHSIRTNNDIVRTKRQSMIDNVTVLDECIHRIQQLTENEESEIIDVVLRLHYTMGHLAESCTMLYNAQFSMRNFSSALINVIDRFIDVLITTDAWDMTGQSEITVEIHKDKCESVHFSLASLRKIITNL